MSWEDELRHRDFEAGGPGDPNRGAPWSHVLLTLIGWSGLVGCLLACAYCFRGC